MSATVTAATSGDTGDTRATAEGKNLCVLTISHFEQKRKHSKLQLVDETFLDSCAACVVFSRRNDKLWFS
jgi:methyl coenzyme M reductase alpha subunit